MIWYVVTDSLENYRAYAGSFCQHKFTLERLSGDCCLLLHYSQVSHKVLTEARPWAICHSGGSALYDTYDILQHKTYGECIRRWDIPQIGFCGGSQVLAVKLGSSIASMRALRDDEADHNPTYHAGQLKEWGVYPVHIVQRDPLFKGLGDTIHVQEYHSWEVKELGRDLILLDSSENCRVQAFVHHKRPVYGAQFHPEQSPDGYQDGFKLLANFFRLARKYQTEHNR
jgi:GMP synthase-like glutamine amidotransferase